MYATINVTCRCATEGDRCGHPIPDRKGPEVYAVAKDHRPVRISRCILWPGHDPHDHHAGPMHPRWGPVVSLQPVGDEYVGVCHRCGEVYTARVEHAGLMVLPPLPEPQTVVEPAE